MCKSGKGWLTRRGGGAFLPIYLRLKQDSVIVYGVAYKKWAACKSEYGILLSGFCLLMFGFFLQSAGVPSCTRATCRAHLLVAWVTSLRCRVQLASSLLTVRGARRCRVRMVRATSASGAETPKNCAVEVSRKRCITRSKKLKTMNFPFQQYKYMYMQSIVVLCLSVIEIFNFASKRLSLFTM